MGFIPFTDLSLSPFFISSSTKRASVGVGTGPPYAMAGPSRSGPTSSCPFFIFTTLSPPTPIERVSRERISVLYPPNLIPSGAKRGTRLIRMDMSVVVPPISIIRVSSSSELNATDPITLAAGPESMVCPGISMDELKFILPPSALRIRIGSDSPFASRDFCTAS